MVGPNLLFFTVSISLGHLSSLINSRMFFFFQDQQSAPVQIWYHWELHGPKSTLLTEIPAQIDCTDLSLFKALLQAFHQHCGSFEGRSVLIFTIWPTIDHFYEIYHCFSLKRFKMIEGKTERWVVLVINISDRLVDRYWETYFCLCGLTISWTSVPHITRKSIGDGGGSFLELSWFKTIVLEATAIENIRQSKLHIELWKKTRTFILCKLTISLHWKARLDCSYHSAKDFPSLVRIHQQQYWLMFKIPMDNS